MHRGDDGRNAAADLDAAVCSVCHETLGKLVGNRDCSGLGL
ncbi:hypothetical protein PAMC26510_00450 [Caballeronia sordidicola]|uniref:Uncharacterized protein n=1 Tax=Caballeronia sordidicola TaxID=196367 RepID=A0A242MFQ1_CABSO|nr:hypothetical protein PAMC26577_29130 [Caballeronia sordidicola]OTP80699.1 hypothetical protein PAMC26510_00450 [Caballeronia sordidicola]